MDKKRGLYCIQYLNSQNLQKDYCIQASHNTNMHAHLSYGLVNSPEGRLFAVMVNPSVSMKYVDAVFFSRRTITAVDTMIWTIIPPAWKLEQALWESRCTNKERL